MTRKEAFIEFVNDLIKNCDHSVEMSEDAEFYWNYLNDSKDKDKTVDKPALTDNGKLILSCLQVHTEIETWTSKALAGVLDISGRTVSGAIRKLVNDGFVEKLENDPVIYAITSKGKEYKID